MSGLPGRRLSCNWCERAEGPGWKEKYQFLLISLADTVLSFVARIYQPQSLVHHIRNLLVRKQRTSGFLQICLKLVKRGKVWVVHVLCSQIRVLGWVEFNILHFGTKHFNCNDIMCTGVLHAPKLCTTAIWTWARSDSYQKIKNKSWPIT